MADEDDGKVGAPDVLGWVHGLFGGDDE